jgi:uncharacterized protein (TIGR00369 family)
MAHNGPIKGPEEEETILPSTGPHQFTMEGWICCAPFEKLLHMTIVRASQGKATLTMPFFMAFAQGAGLLHGGALTSLADTAVVMAIKSLVPPETHFATTSLASTFLRPVTQGIVTAKARVVMQNDRTLKGEATVFDDRQKPVMEFVSIFRIAKNAPVKWVSKGEA